MLGYGTPYRWACQQDVPFTPLSKSLTECRVALLTTAAPYQLDKGDQGPGAAYNGAAKFHRVYSMPTADTPDLCISHIAYDRDHTSAEDMNTWFPLDQMRLFSLEGVIGTLPPRFHGLPTRRSQRTTLGQDCPDVLARLKEDGADAAVIVPNCPVCHQTAGLTASFLERNGLPTVIMGCARDIIEHVGVPRFLFSDFPLGNSAAKPRDLASRDLTLRGAFNLLQEADAARTTVQSPLVWAKDEDWKGDYANIERLSEYEIRLRRREFDAQKHLAIHQQLTR